MTQSTRSDAGGLEWRIRSLDGVSDALAPESRSAWRPWLALQSIIMNFLTRIYRFFGKAWKLAVDEPKKVIHCLKVGLALSVVSLFYYMRPLYDGVGGTAMWAVMTVVVVFEYYVGATLAKSLNRVTATFLAGFLAVGVHWVASQFGENLGPIIVDVSVFLLASLATFSRFIPAVKARFDYGALIFILTFTLISVSGYRVEELFKMARARLVTIVIGTSFCVLISMLLHPAWAGEQLHSLITLNMEKLANSLAYSVAESCRHLDETVTSSDNSAKNLTAYRCVLNSKATEESLANFARWEPGHGCFKYQHPWKQYLKIGAAMRSCAYCIEALNNCIYNNNQASKSIENRLGEICLRLSSSSSDILKELARNIKTMIRSSKMDVLIEEMNGAVQELRGYLKHLPGFPSTEPESETALCLEDNQNKAVPRTAETVSLLEVIPVVTFASLLIKTAGRIEDILDAVQGLADMAEFKIEAAEKAMQNQP